MPSPSPYWPATGSMLSWARADLWWRGAWPASTGWACSSSPPWPSGDFSTRTRAAARSRSRPPRGPGCPWPGWGCSWGCCGYSAVERCAARRSVGGRWFWSWWICSRSAWITTPPCRVRGPWQHRRLCAWCCATDRCIGSPGWAWHSCPPSPASMVCKTCAATIPRTVRPTSASLHRVSPRRPVCAWPWRPSVPARRPRGRSIY